MGRTRSFDEDQVVAAAAAAFLTTGCEAPRSTTWSARPGCSAAASLECQPGRLLVRVPR